MDFEKKVVIRVIDYEKFVGCPVGGWHFTNAAVKWERDSGIQWISGVNNSVYSKYTFKIVDPKKWMLAKIKYGI